MSGPRHLLGQVGHGAGRTCREEGRDLLAAVMPGVTAVVADMTATTFCDASSARMLALVKSQATMQKTRLILVVPSAAVLRALSLTGLDHLLPVYPSLDEALSAESLPRAPVTSWQRGRPTAAEGPLARRGRPWRGPRILFPCPGRRARARSFCLPDSG